MTAAERAFLLKVQRRAAQFSPELAAALASSWQFIRQQLGDSAIAKFLSRGDVEGLLATILTAKLLDRAFQAVRVHLRTTVESSARLTIPDLPSASRGRSLSIALDLLNPTVAQATRVFEDRILTRLKGDVQEVARRLLNESLARGVNGVELGRSLRSVIGLSPNQEQYIENFRRSLLGESDYGSPFDRELRDRRYDTRIRSALSGDGKPLTDAEIEKMMQAYRRGWVNHNGETWGRTLSRNALRVGQKSTWQQAVDRGDLTAEEVERVWIHYMPQPNPREHHRAKHHEAVPMNQPYSNGDTYAGEGDPWNCHCTDIYRITPRRRTQREPALSTA